MKSLSYYDSSYSPNEGCEVTESYFSCDACSDTGMIDEQVYCDCREGTTRCMHEYEDSLIPVVDIPHDELMDSLRDEMSYNGDC